MLKLWKLQAVAGYGSVGADGKNIGFHDRCRCHTGLVEPGYEAWKDDDPWRDWYDMGHAFVVAAETESQARSFAEDANSGDLDRGVWKDHKHSTCRCISEVTTETEGVVLADYKAG